MLFPRCSPFDRDWFLLSIYFPSVNLNSKKVLANLFKVLIKNGRWVKKRKIETTRGTIFIILNKEFAQIASILLKVFEVNPDEIFNTGYIKDLDANDKLPIKLNIRTSENLKEEIDETQSLVC